MEFEAITDPRARSAAACAIIGLYDDGTFGEAARQVDARIGGGAAKLYAAKDFAAKLGDTMLIARAGGSGPARVLVVGLGAQRKFGRKQYQKAVQAAAQAVLKTGAADAVVYLAVDAGVELALDAYARARIVAETFGAQRYRIPDLKTGPKPKPARLREVRVVTARGRDTKAAQRGLDDGVALADGVAFCRDLANLPPNVCTPSYLGTRALSLREFRDVKVTVLGERQIKALKMGAFLAVARGSTEPPRLIVCEYRGAPRARPPICLVGKGITFDSGGISLKDPPAMDEMKFDMGGAASVLGAFRAAAQLRLPINLVAIVPTCENMPAGNAVKPADIVTSMSGQTVEVLNTDAEGRLILCDALAYSRRFKPAAVIDVATLTGACIIALGN
ncbi:MAG TPA: leucyl aminopeptidase, partial [Steroidobacteraceae bacterium]|nr:leucyl aminopeptidase [Steroidobacteraceae bacterium]